MVFLEKLFRYKLCSLRNTQTSIDNLTKWCLKRRHHHKKIVSAWFDIFKKFKVMEYRLVLFYFANNLIQYSSKRDNNKFLKSFAKYLRRATFMVARFKGIKPQIKQIFNIWLGLHIYRPEFVAKLCKTLDHSVEPDPDPESDVEIDTTALFKKIRQSQNLGSYADLQLKRLNESHLPISDPDALREHLKNRQQGDDLVAEVDSGVKEMKAYVNALKSEVSKRKMFIQELNLAERHYEMNNAEANLIAVGYKEYGLRLKDVKRHLDVLLPTFNSTPSSPNPVPTTGVDASETSWSSAPSTSHDNSFQGLADDIGGNVVGETFIPGISDGAARDKALTDAYASFMKMPGFQGLSKASADGVLFDIIKKPTSVTSRPKIKSEVDNSLRSRDPDLDSSMGLGSDEDRTTSAFDMTVSKSNNHSPVDPKEEKEQATQNG